MEREVLLSNGSISHPELFFKTTASRVIGPGGEVRIRSDANWSVPEPELTLVINRVGEIVGYTVGNDMSSRDIESKNPLYLPQKLCSGTVHSDLGRAIANDDYDQGRN